MQRILISLLRGYKRFISPYLPTACRFEPTCSVYSAEALQRFGVFRGLLLTAYRLLRCQPLCRSGSDPVPKRFLGKARKDQSHPDLLKTSYASGHNPKTVIPNGQ